jgi:hypothetical protein
MGPGFVSVLRVRSTLVMEGVDYDKVNSDTAVKEKLAAKVKEVYLDSLPGYAHTDLAVSFSKGSVKAEVDIKPIAGQSIESLKSAVTAKTNHMASAMVWKVRELPEVGSILEDGKTAMDLTVRVEPPKEVSVAVVDSTSVSMAQSLQGRLLVVGVMLAIASGVF